MTYSEFDILRSTPSMTYEYMHYAYRYCTSILGVPELRAKMILVLYPSRVASHRSTIGPYTWCSASDHNDGDWRCCEDHDIEMNGLWEAPSNLRREHEISCKLYYICDYSDLH